MSSTNIFKKSVNENFTIDNILKWYEDINNQLSNDENYTIKLNNDHKIQVEVEHQWIDNDDNASIRLPFNTDKINGKKISSLIHAHPDAHFFTTRTFLNEALSTVDGKSNSITNFFDVEFIPGHKKESREHINLIHEINCRMNSLNSLRINIPNFRYLYGYGKTDQSELFLLYEKNTLGPIRRLDETILLSDEKCTLREFCSLFLQIIFSLKIANDNVGFTHYNFSPENVELLVPEGISMEGEEFYIPYNTESTCLFIKTSYIARITNLSHTHVKCENNAKRSISFGCPNDKDDNGVNYISKCVYRDRSNIMTDVYRFLLTSYKIRKDYLIKIGKTSNIDSDGILSYCSSTLKYFNSTDCIDDIIKSTESKLGLNFPITHYTRIFTINEFINFAKRNIPKGLVKESGKGRIICFKLPAKSPILIYGSGIINSHIPSITIAESDETYFLYPSITIDNFYDLYKFYLSNKMLYNVKTMATDFIKGFSKDKSMLNIAIEDIKTNSHDLNNKIKLLNDKNNTSLINLLRKYQNILIKLRILKIIISEIYWKEERSKSTSPNDSIVTGSDRERSLSKTKPTIPKNIQESEIIIVKNIREFITTINSHNLIKPKKQLELQFKTYKNELMI